MSESNHPAGHVLQAYHDGELDPASEREVAAHCELCASCRAELAELEHVVQFLAGAQAPELPSSVWQRVQPGRTRESRLKPGFAVAACAAGVVLGLLLGPIQFSAQETSSELAWSESVTAWNGEATSPLLAVYQSEQE